jgi:hypothetical protein
MRAILRMAVLGALLAACGSGKPEMIIAYEPCDRPGLAVCFEALATVYRCECFKSATRAVCEWHPWQFLSSCHPDAGYEVQP